jgi:hypothetical protein
MIKKKINQVIKFTSKYHSIIDIICQILLIITEVQIMSISTILGAAIPGTQISAGSVLTAGIVGAVGGVATGIGMYIGLKVAAKVEEKEEKKVKEPEEEKTEKVKVKDVKSKKVKKILDEAKDVTTEEVES